jgi:hypothetical protein
MMRRGCENKWSIMRVRFGPPMRSLRLLSPDMHGTSSFYLRAQFFPGFIIQLDFGAPATRA